MSGLPPVATVGPDIPARQLRANKGLGAQCELALAESEPHAVREGLRRPASY